MRSKGDVSRVFLATVSHGIGFLFLFSFAACFVVRGFRACVLLFAALGGGVPRPDFARRGPKDVFVDSKGNVKEFFGSGFGRFRLVSRWCLGLFGSRAPRPERVLLFEAFGLVFCCSRLILRQFCSVFCCARLWACVLLFEAFGSDVPKARFREAQKMFLWIPKVTWKSFLVRVLAVFGSCPDGV